ncbi:hypothetical protein CCACVL1_08837, partial [Corchorus capsularis]
ELGQPEKIDRPVAIQSIRVGVGFGV